MVKVPKGLLYETKAIIRLYLFLRHECGLKEADRLSARELGELISLLKIRLKFIGIRGIILLNKRS